MTKRLLFSVRGRRTLNGAWQVIERNGRLSKSAETRAEIREFAKDARVHLERIQRQLLKDTFVFKPAKGIKARRKGKAGFRPLVVAPIESRIVQRAVHDVLLSVPSIEALVRTPHSFGGVKKNKEDLELSAVPAAIKAVLEAIGNGGAYVVRSDITKFFTRIPKPEVRRIIAAVIDESDFLRLFDKAVVSELSNMKDLREDAYAFPIEDIGVAQGNSLSPLLGNLLLKDFDLAMNSLPSIRCIRFIDDFVLLGPNRALTMNAFQKAQTILNQWQMTLAHKKTEQGSSQQPFEFLGIEFNNGLLRPCKAARERFLESVNTLLQESKQALFDYKTKGVIERRSALLKTLAILSDSVHSWGMHYTFCNDSHCLRQMDARVTELISDYLATYRTVRNAAGPSSTWNLLGIQSLEKIERKSFTWPKGTPKAYAP